MMIADGAFEAPKVAAKAVPEPMQHEWSKVVGFAAKSGYRHYLVNWRHERQSWVDEVDFETYTGLARSV